MTDFWIQMKSKIVIFLNINFISYWQDSLGDLAQ